METKRWSCEVKTVDVFSDQSSKILMAATTNVGVKRYCM